MSESQELAMRAPKTGPWLIAYMLWFCAGTIVASQFSWPGVAPAAFAVPFWGGIVIIVAMIIYTSWRRHRLLGTLSAASRKFWPRIVAASALMFGGFCAIAFVQLQMAEQSHLARYVFMLPTLGFMAMVWCVYQYVRDENDEYLRAQAVRQLLIASFVALIGSLAMGPLSALGQFDRAAFDYATGFWFVGMGVGRLYNELRP